MRLLKEIKVNPINIIKTYKLVCTYYDYEDYGDFSPPNANYTGIAQFNLYRHDTPIAFVEGEYVLWSFTPPVNWEDYAAWSFEFNDKQYQQEFIDVFNAQSSITHISDLHTDFSPSGDDLLYKLDIVISH